MSTLRTVALFTLTFAIGAFALLLLRKVSAIDGLVKKVEG